MEIQTLGEAGEIIAGKLLVARGFKILERNFTCPLGEVDLIAERNGTRHFIEVKTRSGRMFGQPAEAVTGKKQKKLRRLAQYYMVAQGYRGPVAFGVAEVDYRSSVRRFRAELIEHAF